MKQFKFRFCLILRYKAFLTVPVNIYIYMTWWSTMSKFPRTTPFLQGMTFHTQSNNRNKIKVDIGRHILNDLNLNIKRRENLKATYPVIF